MKRIFFMGIVLALAFGLALSAAPQGLAKAQADPDADQPPQISAAKLPPGWDKSIAETRVARFSPPRAGLDKAKWSYAFSQSSEFPISSGIFKDYLYVATSRFNDTGEGAQIFRTADGETWEAVTLPAFGNPMVPGDYYISYFWGLKEFKGKLYAGFGFCRCDLATYYEPYGQVWRSADGITWEKVLVVTDDPWNEMLLADSDFQGQIYAATVNFDTGFEIWRSPSGDTGDWEMVADNSLDTYLPAPGVSTFAFKDTLFVLPGQILNLDYSQAPLHIWSSRDGQNYEVVTADGFGDPRVLYAWNWLEFRGDFYVQEQVVDPETYAETIRVMRTHDGVNWSVFCENCQGLGSVVKGHVYQIWWNADLGLEVYRSADLLSWEKIDWQGFDAPGMTGGWGPFAIFKGDIYFIVYDESGNNQLWRMSTGNE